MGGGEEEEEVGGGETGPRFPETPKLISKPKIKSEMYSFKITPTPLSIIYNTACISALEGQWN